MGYANATFQWNNITKKELSVLSDNINLAASYEFINHQDTIIAVPSNLTMSIKILLSHLYVKKMGLAIGEIKGMDLIPDHALAMSHWSNMPFGSVEVDHDLALQYLRRADIHLEGTRGWALVMYKNIRLGWAKLLPNITNNYYPTSWRILKY